MTRNTFDKGEKVLIGILLITIALVCISSLDYGHEKLMERIYVEGVCNGTMPNYKGWPIEKLERLHPAPCNLSGR
tara:strand:+ start:791 stop:1015 length:225 start_codon:yes stop_codon:yes gene_type:complete